MSCWLGLLLVSLGCVTLTVEAYRVLGWKLDNYKDTNANKYLHTSYKFGDQSNDDGEWITWGDWTCWTGSAFGYCKLRMKVTNENGREHFQIQGSAYDVYSTDSNTFCGTTKNGELSGEKHGLGEGKGWNGCKNGWGYKYLRLYGVWTTEMPLTYAFSYQKMKSSNQEKKLTEVVMGDKGEYDAMHEIIEFRSHSSNWGATTVIKLRYWNPPTTLIGFEPHFSESTVEDIGSVVASYRSIKNEGCGDQGTWEAGMTGTQTDTVEITLTTTVAWSTTYSYSFEVTSSVAAEIERVTVELTSTSGFTFETSESFEETQTVTKTTEYKWPTYCPTGRICKTELVRVTSQTILPATLTFQRGKDTYTQENHMESSMQATQENDSQEPIEGFVDPCSRK